MPSSCTVCRHAERSAIDQALESAVSLRRIAGHYGLALTSLYRHKQHVGIGCGTAPEHPDQPATIRPAVPPALITDLRRQAMALRLQADQLQRDHRSYHDYPSDALLVQLAQVVANVVEMVCPGGLEQQTPCTGSK